MTGRRVLVVVVLLAAVLVPAWPAWLGWQADRQLSAYQGGRVGDLTLVHSLESFDRGWLESSALSRMRVSAGADTLDFEVYHRVRHAFGGVVVESEPVYPPELAEHLTTIFGERAPLTVTTRLGPGGDSAEIHLESPAFSSALPDDPAMHLRSAGLAGKFRVEGRRLRGSLRLPELVLADPESTLTLVGQVLELDLADPGSRVADGSVEYRLDTLDVTGPEEAEAIRVQKVRVRSVQTRRGERVDLSLHLGFGAVEAVGWEASQGDARLELGPLHAHTYDALLRELEQLPPAADGEADPGARAGAVLMEHLPVLLKHSPEIRLDPLRLQMPGGVLELALGAGYDGRDTSGEVADTLERVRIYGRLHASRALAEELAGAIGLRNMGDDGAAAVDPEARRLLAGPLGRGMLQGLVAEGYLREEGDEYRTDLSVENGRLSINGEDRSEWLYLLLAGLFAPSGFN
jgi:uncharacterized protein YdgA (DUF945 family)